MSRPRSRGAGEGTIFKRKDGRWTAELFLGVDPTGKRQVWRAYGKTRKEVSDALAAVIADREAGERVETNRQTVGVFLTRWLDGQKIALAENTYRGYERAVRLRWQPALGNHLLRTLNPQQVQSALARFAAAGAAASSIGRYRAILSAALADAERWGLVRRNAAALTEPPRIAKPDIRPLSLEDARKVLAAIDGHPLAALYKVVLALGLRQGEALGLRWQDIDLRRRQLVVTMNLQSIGGKLQLVETKTRTSRVVALPDVAVVALQERQQVQALEARRAGPHWSGNPLGLVFTTRVGTPLHRRNVVRQWTRFLAQAGVAHQRFYDLRHTCASLLAAQGVPMKDISTLLGHASIRTTADLYTHLTVADQRKTAATMDEILREKMS